MKLLRTFITGYLLAVPNHIASGQSAGVVEYTDWISAEE